MEKLIITVAPVGAEVTKEENPNIPLTPEEIAEEVLRSYNVGASVVHLHARDEFGRPTQKKERYQEIIDKIKEKVPDIIIQISTGGAIGMSFEERAEPLELNPEFASLTLGTVNFGEGVFFNPPDWIKKFALIMKERKIKPEIEIFEAGMIDNALRLLKDGILEEPLHFDFVLGVPGGMSGEPKNLIFLINSLPKNSTWMVAGIGKWEYPLGVIAVTLGGNVRVGFEDNIYLKKGVLAKSNAELVERITKFSLDFGREIASPNEARVLLNIKKYQKF
ncbi:MAG: 3-keto-5-aminohexanoate cleavage protein [Caldisericia bacterium]